MQIGETIRKYRKVKNMTQEEMANRLGVTAPAVNKWENGNSLPDIMLLAPIARLLDITVDTLLAFREELTQEEIAGFVHEADSRLKNGTYEDAFQWAKEKIEMYPNCEQLIWQMALIFDIRRLTNDVSDSEKYDSYIIDWYVRALNSEDEKLKTQAAESLFGFYVRKEQYEKAEEYLSYLSDQNPERKRKQAMIYSKTGQVDKAYKAYEELLFSGCQMLNIIFNDLYILAMQENQIEKAHKLVDKQQELARLFEMGEYYEASSKLELATMEKDADTVIDAMEKMLANIENMSAFTKSSLYEHMTFKEAGAEFHKRIREGLLKLFRDEKTYGFLKNDERWQRLVDPCHEG